MNVSSPRLVAQLTSPSLTAGLQRFVRARVPECEVEDIVQATLSDALVAETHPEDDTDIVRWVYGICRHKIIDRFRRLRREVPKDLEEEETAAAESAPTGAMDLMRWARKELPAGKENEQTLEWMLREGAGEKLENIAAEAKVPAPRVRQRVSRLRRYFKAKWAAQMAAVATLLLLAIAVAMALRGRTDDTIAPRPEPSIEPSNAPLPMLPPSLPAVDTNPDAAPSATSEPEPAPTDSPIPSAMPKPPAPKPSPIPTTNSAPPPPTSTFDSKPRPPKGGPRKASAPAPVSTDSFGSDSISPAPAPTGAFGSDSKNNFPQQQAPTQPTKSESAPAK